MPRTVKEYDERYAEFLDTAQALFFSQGFASTSVQNIIDAVGVAKGTFYHYFDSKEDVLTAVVERMFAQTLHTLQPIVDASSQDARQKLAHFVNEISQWKVANKPLFMEMAHALYRDENILLRQKMQQGAIQATAPLLAEIIRQGMREGLFEVAHPLETAQMLLVIPRPLSDAFVALLLDGDEPDAAAVEEIYRHVAATNQAVERVLGMKPGTFTYIDPQVIDTWLND